MGAKCCKSRKRCRGDRKRHLCGGDRRTKFSIKWGKSLTKYELSKLEIVVVRDLWTCAQVTGQLKRNIVNCFFNDDLARFKLMAHFELSIPLNTECFRDNYDIDNPREDRLESKKQFQSILDQSRDGKNGLVQLELDLFGGETFRQEDVASKQKNEETLKPTLKKSTKFKAAIRLVVVVNKFESSPKEEKRKQYAINKQGKQSEMDKQNNANITTEMDKQNNANITTASKKESNRHVNVTNKSSKLYIPIKGMRMSKTRMEKVTKPFKDAYRHASTDDFGLSTLALDIPPKFKEHLMMLVDFISYLIGFLDDKELFKKNAEDMKSVHHHLDFVSQSDYQKFFDILDIALLDTLGDSGYSLNNRRMMQKFFQVVEVYLVSKNHIPN